MALVAKIQSGALATETFPCITTAAQLAELKERIPAGARVAVDTEGSPSPFCVFVAFLDANLTLVYGAIAVRLLQEPSVLDLKFQAGVGWQFRPATGNEAGIHYEFVDPDGTVRQIEFDDGASAEKSGATIITVARVASAAQVRALASGEAVSFTNGRNAITVTLDKADEALYAAELPAEHVAKTGEIWHLVGDTMPAYQNATLEQVLTRRLVPVKIEPALVQDDCFYVIELADATGKKTDFVPVHAGCRLHTTSAKPLVRIVSQKGAGSTINLPPTDLEQDVVGAFMQSLKEKQVTFAAHNKPKEEKDLDITVEEDSHDIMKILTPFMTAANLKAVGSSAVFHLFHAILRSISSQPLVVCGDKDLVACSDIHSLPVEVCVLALLYQLLTEVPQEEIRDALRSSVSLEGKEQIAAVQATLDSVVLLV